MSKKLDCTIELKRYRETIEKYLDITLPPANTEPKLLHRAMRYSVFSGGKRLRPLLVLVVGGMLKIEKEKLLPVACGIELIHNFSLIHDDLPAMDNDDFRRGKKTCHKKFSEAVAILAGDALLTLGLKLVGETGNVPLIKATADAIGSEGMAGGQVFDIMYKNKKISGTLKKNIDIMKTGKLFQLCFSAPLFFKRFDKKIQTKMLNISSNFGLAFQIRDDMEDGEGNVEVLKRSLSLLYKEMKNDIAFFGEKGALLSYIVENLYKF
ncbi:MAG: polyprenyl synthetase family protein [bacterium]|nr:polyprenyl synthetase family protein [bacterium]